MSGFPIPSDSWLLMAALSTPSPCCTWVNSRRPTPLPDLDCWLAWADDQGVACMVESSLKSLDTPLWPMDQVVPRAAARRRSETARWILFEQVCKNAVAALAAGLEVPPLVIKGGSLRYTLYPAPWQRPCRDLDLLVHPLSMRKAVQLLEAEGFVAETHPWAPQELATAINLDREGVRIEIHSSLFSRYRPDAGYNALSARCVPLEVYPGAITPDMSGHFLMGVLHLVRHGFLLKLKDLADLDRIVRTGQVDWNFVHTQLDAMGFVSALEWALTLLARLMETPLPTEAWPATSKWLSPRKFGRLLASPTRPEFWLLGRHLHLHAASALTLLTCADSVLPLADAVVDWSRRRLHPLGKAIH